MTQYFNMFEFWMFCNPTITIIAIIYPSPSQMKGCIACFTSPPQKKRRLEKHSTLSFPRLRMHNPFFSSVGRIDGWKKKKAWGVTEVSQLSKTPAHPSVLLSTNDQRPWISASSPGTTAVATLSFSVGFDGGTWRQRSWLQPCQAEQPLGDTDTQPCCASRVAKPAESPASQLLPPNAKLAP